MTGITGPTTATYTYNGDGERVSKKVGINTTRYVWDPSGVAYVLANCNGEQYVWGNGLVSYITNLGNRRYPLADGLGSVRVLTDHNGAAIGTQTYDAYGSVRTSSGFSMLPVGFSGEQTDSESGLIYLRARYMDPTTGRFLSKDPAKSGWAYGYANDYPDRANVRAPDPARRLLLPTGQLTGRVRRGRAAPRKASVPLLPPNGQ